MTELEINKIIHEAMGKCWHKKVGDYKAPRFYGDTQWGTYSADICGECGTETPHNPSYTSSWSDYGQALEWAKGQEWFREFLNFAWVKILSNNGKEAVSSFVGVENFGTPYFRVENNPGEIK